VLQNGAIARVLHLVHSFAPAHWDCNPMRRRIPLRINALLAAVHELCRKKSALPGAARVLITFGIEVAGTSLLPSRISARQTARPSRDWFFRRGGGQAAYESPSAGVCVAAFA